MKKWIEEEGDVGCKREGRRGKEKDDMCFSYFIPQAVRFSDASFPGSLPSREILGMRLYWSHH